MNPGGNMKGVCFAIHRSARSKKSSTARLRLNASLPYYSLAVAIVVCGTLCSSALLASLDPAKPLHQFVRQNWRADQGLPQNSVLSVAETKEGYLWLGTEEGLSRFDGARFVTFDTSNSGLKDNIVKALLVDQQGTLWIGTQNGGLSTYRDGKFSSVPTSTQLDKFSISNLYQDRAGTLWVGTDDSGLIQLRSKEHRRFTTTDGLPDNSVVSIRGGPDGTLWVATRKGLSRLQNGRFSAFETAARLTSDDVLCMEVDHEGSLWIGTVSGLTRVKNSVSTHFSIKDGLSANEITSLKEDSAHTLWVGTGQKGLNRLAQGRFSTLEEDSALLGTDIGAIFEDRAGDIWLGTGGHGLIGLKEGTFTTITTKDGLASDSILPILEDRHGALWVGSDHGLSRIWNGKTRIFTTSDGLASDFIFSLAEDANGVLWVGTRQGICQIVDDVVRTFPEQKSLPTPAALVIFPDKQGSIWIATRGGLSRYDGNSITTYTTRDGLPDSLIRTIAQDRQGVLWLGTSSGLAERSHGRFRSYTTADGLSGNDILGIHCDEDNVIWLATSKGINRMRAGHITAFNKIDRTLDVSISTILEDRAHSLWFTSNRGIVRIAKSELTRYADGLINQAIHPVWFGVTDGMKSAECNGGFQPAGWTARDGRLYVPTAGGVAVLDPRRAPQGGGDRTIIERLVIDAVEFPPEKPARVPPGPGRLEIQFTSPDLHFQNKLQFRYMLVGFDRDWVDADSQRIAHYTNIPHGEYQFRIQSGTGGVWSKDLLSPELVLQPHFYETRSFFIFIAISFFSVAGAIYRIRTDQIASREQKLRALVDERTSALRESEAQLRQSRDELELRVKDRTKELTHVNHSLEEEIRTRQQTEQLLILAKEAAESANRAKSQFLTNMSHELRTPINGILGMTEITLSTQLDAEQTEYLEVAKVSADSLLAIVNDILDFSKIEARKLHLEHAPFQLRKTVDDVFRAIQLQTRPKGLRFDMAVDPGIPDNLIGDQLRLRQVLLNLLDNAVKFTKLGGIDLILTAENCAGEFVKVHFEVKDTGIGISPEKREIIFEAFSQADNSSTRRYGGTGLGLTISHELAVMLGGKLWVESVLGQGSTFHFTAKLQIAERSGDLPVSGSYTKQLNV